MRFEEKIIEGLTNVVWDLYKASSNNHELKRKIELKKPSVIPGRNPTIAPIFEKSIAELLFKVFPKYYFLVDHPITLMKNKEKSLNRNSIYPDVLILDSIEDEKANIISIIELKVDIGHLNLEKEAQALKKRIRLYKKTAYFKFNTYVGAYTKDDKKKNKNILAKFRHSEVKKIAIICTKNNQHKSNNQNNSEKYERLLKNYGFHPIFLLNENTHPNSGNKFMKSEIESQLNTNRNEILRAFRSLNNA